MYCDRIAFSCESEWIIISTSHLTKWHGACSTYNHPSWDGGLADARSLVGPQCGHKLLGPAPGSRRGPGQRGRAPSPECSGMLCQDQGLILEGATPAPGEALQGEPGAPAGVASGAGSQLHSLPGAGVAPHLAWEGGVGYRPTALPRAHRKLKDNVEQSYNCCNRHCGWKSFLTAPDSLWEG